MAYEKKKKKKKRNIKHQQKTIGEKHGGILSVAAVIVCAYAGSDAKATALEVMTRMTLWRELSEETWRYGVNNTQWRILNIIDNKRNNGGGAHVWQCDVVEAAWNNVKNGARLRW